VQVLTPLRQRPFDRLAAAYTLNQVGDYVGLIALNVLVYTATGEPFAVAVLLLAMQFAPAVVAPVLTARVDTLPAGRTLFAIYLGEAAIFGLLVLVSQAFSLALVLILALLDGVLMLTARAVIRADMNRVLEPAGLLRDGNALVNMGFAVAAVSGAALGGVLVGAFSVTTALAVDAVSFVVVALLIRTIDRGRESAIRTERVSTRARLREGMGHVRRNRLLGALLGGEGLAIVLFTLTSPVQVVFAIETLGAGEAGYGAMATSWGAGVLAGSLAFLRLRRRSSAALIAGSTLALGVGFLGTGFSRELWLACAFSALGGFGNGIQWVSVLSLLQENISADLQARIVGLLESIASAAMGLGFLLGGALTSLTSPPTAYLLSGTGVVALVAAATVVRWLTPRRPLAAPSGGASTARR
jgi:predicted MFS family arabinose efflux permease